MRPPDHPPPQVAAGGGTPDGFTGRNQERPTMQTPTPADLVASLRSTTCPACGGEKRPNETLCSHEYYRLPRAKRNRLYDYVSAGYAEAVVAAFLFLGVDTFTMPPTPGA